MRARIGLAFSVAVACCLFLVRIDAQAITFADGSTHTIDAANSYPFEGALIADGPGPTSTTVNVVSGGNIGGSAPGTVNVEDTSRLNVSGGTIRGTVSLSGSSRSEISGGSVTNSVYANNTSSILLSGGTVGNLYANDQAVVEVVGGGGNELSAQGSSSVSVSNGSFEFARVAGIAAIMNISGGSFTSPDPDVGGGWIGVGPGGTANITGGTFTDIGGYKPNYLSVDVNGGNLNVFDGSFTHGARVLGNGQVSVFGGSFGGGITSSNSSQLSVSGGSFGGGIRTSNVSMAVIAGAVWNGDFIALDSSHITISGSGFNLPLGDLAAISGTLSGILADGSALSVNFGRASTATITLVPEPSTALLLAGGIAVLAVGRRRNSRAALSRRESAA